MLHCNNLSKSYKEFELKDFSCQFKPGLNLITGKSGSGKTTLLRMILNTIKPDSGSVVFDEPFDEKTKFNDFIAFLPFDNFLNKSLTLRKSISISSQSGISLDTSKAEKLIELFDFREYADKKLYKLSGGERKTANLIYCLCKNYTYLILDEPFSSLDKKRKTLLSDYLYKESENKCVIVVDHSSSLDSSKLVSSLDMNTKVQTFSNQDVKRELAKRETPINKGTFFGVIKATLINSKRNFSSTFVIFFLCLLSVLLISSSLYFTEPSKAEVSKFYYENDPYTYLPLSTNQLNLDKENVSDSLIENEEQDSVYVFSLSSHLCETTGALAYDANMYLIGINNVEDNCIYYSSKEEGVITPAYSSSNLTLNFKKDNNPFYWNNDLLLTLYGAEKSVSDDNVYVLYCSKPTFKKCVEDSFYYHLTDYRGYTFQGNASYKLDYEENIGHIDSKKVIFVEGDNIVGVKGKESGEDINAGIISSFPMKTTIDGDTLTDEDAIYLSFDVLFRLGSHSLLLEGTNLCSLINKKAYETVASSSYYFYSNLSVYLNYNQTLNIYFMSFIIAGVVLLAAAVLYILKCESKLVNRTGYQKLILKGYSEKVGKFIHFGKYLITILLVLTITLIVISIQPGIMNGILGDLVIQTSTIVNSVYYSKLQMPLYFIKHKYYIYLAAVGLSLLIGACSYLSFNRGIKKNDRD